MNKKRTIWLMGLIATWGLMPTSMSYAAGPKIAPNACHYSKSYDSKHNTYQIIITCPKNKNITQKINDFFGSVTPAKHSALAERISAEKAVIKSKRGLSFYEPTYILPFYMTGRPYQSIYQGTTPENQAISSEELKGQLSVQFPVWYQMFGSKMSLNVSYTQLSFWQVYSKSPYFRETDYEPQLFLSDNFSPNWLASFGINHQSNGRGGQLERSWNRLFFDVAFSGEHWIVDVKPWVPIFEKDSSDLHNPDITRYLGYGRAVIAVKFNNQQISLMTRNALESGFKRGAIQLDYNFPIHGLLHGDIQYFSGYGQSLIEYNHYTNSIGLGISISNWL